MVSLAQNFMRDLDELSDEEEKGKEEHPTNNGNVAPGPAPHSSLSNVAGLKLEQVSKLVAKKDFLDHLAALEQDEGMAREEQKLRNLSPSDPMYELLAKSNKYLLQIEGEIPILHKFVRDIYILKFPELETLIPHPVEYARVVQRIANTTNLTGVELADILPNNSIISITVAASNSKGRLLTPDELSEVERGCADILALDQGRTKILKYMEKRMQLIAPNVCAIVGPAIGAKLIAAAGGIVELAKMPACNIQVLGAHRKALHGLSTATVKLHRGFIAECEFVNVAPEPLQKNVIRMLSTKTALAARADMSGTSPKGEIGQELKERIVEQFKKIQAPKVPRVKRPLPKPDDKPRRKRAGKHLTAFRKRVQMTEYRKYENRMSFGAEPQKEYRESGRTFGMLQVKGTKKLKVRAETNQKILQKYNPTQKPLGDQHTTGLSSSLVFTQVQGIQLYNPDYIADQIKEQKDLYFSSKAGFTTVTALKRAAPEPTKKIIL